MRRSSFRNIHLFCCLLICFIIIFAIVGCSDKPKLATEYQAVFLDNGQVFFGKLENAGSTYPLLTDVFYIQSRMNPETNQATNILLKRGNEWHGPDSMSINARHIVVIEPVSPTSKVAQLIKDAKAQKPQAN